MGVTECDNMLMLLGVSNKMLEKVRAVRKPNVACEGKSARRFPSKRDKRVTVLIGLRFPVPAGARQSDAAGHPGVQRRVGGGGDVCNGGADRPQPLGGAGRRRHDRLPAQRVHHVRTGKNSAVVAK